MKQSAVARALTLFMPLNQGIASRTDYASLAREGFIQNSVVFACIKEISEAAAGVSWLLYERTGEGGLKEIVDHPLLRLIERPNPLQGKFEFIESTMAHLYLSGNAYIECVGASASKPNGGVKPRELYTLRPDRMRVLPHPVNLIAGYEYHVGSETVRFTPDRLLHLKLFHPLDDWYGLSPVQVAALAIDKMNSGDRWNAALLNNSAVPSGALVSKERLTETQFDRLKSEMRDQMQGIKNAREPLLLEQDLEWKELAISPRDMDWVEGLKLSALQIAQVYNMPPELIGLTPATYQNRREARKALYTEVVCPALNRFRDALNTWLTPRFGENLLLDFDKDRIEALSEDQDALWNRAGSSPFLTLNEKRRMVGFDDLPGGDTLKGPASQPARRKAKTRPGPGGKTLTGK